MNYASIINNDVLNGDGFGVTLFVSGCGKNPKCKYCQNQDAWDFNYGKPYTQETEDYIIRLMSSEHINHLSILGGEPMDNLEDNTLIKLVNRCSDLFPNKKIWCWSGYTIEELINKSRNINVFLKSIDYLIDGEYDYTKKNLNNKWRNSENQRLILTQNICF